MNAPREFKRRIERVVAQLKRNAKFSPLELTAVYAEIEALENDLPPPLEYATSPVAKLGDLGQLPGFSDDSSMPHGHPDHPMARHAAAAEARKSSEERAKEARQEAERDKLARLWALERAVLERSRGYQPTARHAEL